jgi:hypothetical protein
MQFLAGICFCTYVVLNCTLNPQHLQTKAAGGIPCLYG